MLLSVTGGPVPLRATAQGKALWSSFLKIDCISDSGGSCGLDFWMDDSGLKDVEMEETALVSEFMTGALVLHSTQTD